MTVDAVCLGETMALLAPDPPVPLADADHLRLAHAGAESNVAAGLASLGNTVRWCTRVGDDPLGRRIVRDIAAAGVDTTCVRISTDRPTGLMLKDPSAGGTRVLYYRAGSAAAAMDESDADRALADPPRLLHLTGITAALSASCAAAVDHAIGRARELGVTISYDVNYRPALWPDRASAARHLRQQAQRGDIVFVGLDEAATLWNTTEPQQVRELLPTPRTLVVKDGARAAWAVQGDQWVEVAAFPVAVVEPVGAGDAFAAGWLHAHLAGLTSTQALKLGHLMAAAALASATDHGELVQAVGRERVLAAAGENAPWPPNL